MTECAIWTEKRRADGGGKADEITGTGRWRLFGVGAKGVAFRAVVLKAPTSGSSGTGAAGVAGEIVVARRRRLIGKKLAMGEGKHPRSTGER